MRLEDALQEVHCFVESDLQQLAARPPVEDIGRLCDELSANFRTLAGSCLLLGADTEGFRRYLRRSGMVRQHFLSRCRETPELRNPYCAASNCGGFMDAVAAGDSRLAGEIADLSPQEWWEGEEYAEDFYFVSFLHRFVRPGPEGSRRELEKTLIELRAVDEGTATVMVCGSLLNPEQEAFDDAFSALLDARDAELAEDAETFFPDDRVAYRIKRRIFIEGLAILNLADGVGLRTSEEYRYCPLLARLPATQALDPVDLF